MSQINTNDFQNRHEDGDTIIARTGLKPVRNQDEV